MLDRILGWFRERRHAVPEVDGLDVRLFLPLMLFDGECGVCNQLVQFAHRHDTEGVLHYVALQSDLGQTLSLHAGVEPGTVSTMVLVEPRGMTTRSTAALRLTRYFGFPWSLAALGLFVPRIIRDAAYRIFARVRYQVFGRADACVIDPKLAARMVEGDTLERESRGSSSLNPGQAP